MRQSLKKARKVRIKAHIIQASSTVRFPCYFNVLWRTQDNHQIQTPKSQTIQGKSIFNQTLQLQLSLVYDPQSQRYAKYETQIFLRLISKHKDTQPKLVGRKSLDISQLMNGGIKIGVDIDFQLEFCSVYGVVKMRFETQEIRQEEQIVVEEKKIGDYRVIKDVKIEHNEQSMANKSKTRNIASQPKSPPSDAKPSISLRPFQDAEQNTQQARLSLHNQPQIPEKTLSPPILNPNSEKSIQSQLQFQSKPQTQRPSHQSNLEQIKLKSIQQDFKRQTHKLIQENQLLRLTLQQKDQELDEQTTELAVVRQQNLKLREDINRKIKDNVDMQLQHSELKAEKLKLLSKLANFHRENTKMTALINQLQKQANLFKTDVQEKIIVIQSQNRLLRQYGIQLQNRWVSAENAIQTLTKQFSCDSSAKEQNLRSLDEEYNNAKVQWQKQHEENTSKIKNLNCQISTLRDKMVQLQARLSSKEIENERLSSLISVKSQEIGKLSAQVQSLKSELQEKGAIVQNLQNSLIAINQELATSKKSIKALQNQIEQNINKTQEMINHHQKYLQQLSQANITEKTQLRQQLELKLSQSQQLLQIIKREKAQLSSSLQLLEVQNRRLYSQNQIISSKISQLQQLLLSNNQLKTKELTQIQEIYHQNQIMLRNLEQKYNQSITLTKKYQSKIEVLALELDQRSTIIEKLKDGLQKQIELSQTLNSKIINSAQQNQNQLRKINLLQNQLFSITKMLNEAELQQQHLKERNNSLEMEGYRLVGELEKEGNKNLDLENEIKTKEIAWIQQIQACMDGLKIKDQLIQSLQVQLSSKENEIQSIKAKLTKLQNDHREIIHRGSLTIENYQEKIDKYRSDLQQMTLQSQLKARKQIEATTELVKKSLQLQELTQQLSLKNKEIQGLLLAKDNLKLEYQSKIVENNEAAALKEQTYRETIEDLYGTIENLTLEHQQRTEKDTEAMLQLSQHVKVLEANLVELQQQQNQLTKLQLQSKDNLISELNAEIQTLKDKISTLRGQLTPLKAIKQTEPQREAYISQLEHSLKQKTQELQQLQLDIERLATEAQQVYELRQQVQAYKQELELNEEERFNLQSENNQMNMKFLQLSQENLAISNKNNQLIEKISSLQRAIAQLQTLQQQNDSQLRIQLSQLRIKYRQLQGQYDTLKQQLDQKDQQHVVELIDQHIRLSRSDMQNSHLAKSQSKLPPKEGLPDLGETCQVLKSMIIQRKPLEEELLVSVQNKNKENAKIQDIPNYSRRVSLELQKAKAIIMKHSKSNSSINQVLRNCEHTVKALCEYVEECCLL